LRVELILEAIDRASGTINKVRDAARGLEAVGRSEKFAKAQEAAADRQKDALIGVTAAAATAASIAAPITKAATAWNSYEDALTDVALKYDLNKQKATELGNRVRTMAKDLNRDSLEIMQGVDQLAAGGLAVDAAMTIIPGLTKASVATKAAMDDLGKSATALINEMKVAPAEIGKALDVMAKAGKEGQFEVKDMARYFPKLGSQYASMGQTGVRAVADLAAALQVLRAGMGSSESAVAGLEDLLNKITLGPAKKAFEALGIDSVAAMQKGMANGKVMETIHDLIQQATGGDLSKLNTIFSDKQALGAARALMQKWEEFRRIRAEAISANSVIDLDFARRLGLGVEQVKGFNVAVSELWTTLGNAIAPSFNAKIEKMTQLIWQIEAWVKLNPELAAGIAKAATAVALLLVGMAALKLVWAVLGSGLLTLIGIMGRLVTVGRLLLIPFAFLKGVLGGIAAGISAAGGVSAIAGALFARFGAVLRFLLAPLAMAARGVMMLGAAMLTTPIGWILMGIAAVAAGAYYVYRNWSTIGPMLAKAWESLKTAAKAAWDGVTEAFSDAWERVKAWFGSLEWPSLPEFPDVLGGLSAALEPAIKWLGGWGERLHGAFTAAFGKVGEFLGGAAERIGKLISPVTDALSKASDFVFGPSATTVKATAEQATAAKLAIDAIPPAAREAVAQANAVLANQNWQSHGVRLMQTLAAGIRAGAAEAVAAVRDTVQKMRDHLPHSPAKVGPLSDLDRVQFAQTLAGAITRGAPRAIMAAQALAAGLAATIPEPASAGFAGMDGAGRAGATQAGVSGGGGSLTLNPVFNVTVNGGAGGEDFKEQLRAYAYELAGIVEAELKRRDRATY
jgi:TP901 family phage tail tape measure protein